MYDCLHEKISMHVLHETCHIGHANRPFFWMTSTKAIDVCTTVYQQLIPC